MHLYNETYIQQIINETNSANIKKNKTLLQILHPEVIDVIVDEKAKREISQLQQVKILTFKKKSQI